jgi:hypothetical protein
MTRDLWLVILGAVLAFGGGLLGFFIQWWWNRNIQRKVVLEFLQELLRAYPRGRKVNSSRSFFATGICQVPERYGMPGFTERRAGQNGDVLHLKSWPRHPANDGEKTSRH